MCVLINKNKITALLQAFIFLLSVVSLQSCSTYRGFPEDKVNQPPQKKYSHVSYRLKGKSIFKGFKKLSSIFKESTPFKNSTETTTMPEEGYFINVEVSNVSPSMSAVSFGYISYSTLTILPFWSTDNGNNIKYELYKNGSLIHSHTYEIRRKLFVWLPMLPLIWVNKMTYYEREAFSASAYDFFEESDKFIHAGINKI